MALRVDVTLCFCSLDDLLARNSQTPGPIKDLVMIREREESMKYLFAVMCSFHFGSQELLKVKEMSHDNNVIFTCIYIIII